MSDDFMFLHLNVWNTIVGKNGDDVLCAILVCDDNINRIKVAAGIQRLLSEAIEFDGCCLVYARADSHDVLLEGAGAPCLLGNRGGLDNERRRGDFLVAVEHDLGDAGLSLEAGEVDA